MTAIMKIHFTLLIIVMSLSVQAQKMVTKTAEWNYMHEEFDVPTTSWYIKALYAVKYQNKDTVINGKEYLLFNVGGGVVGFMRILSQIKCFSGHIQNHGHLLE
ncbi:MAG: hypothetical protein LAT54_08785 [Cryomorphaceae bacterium]|nr:hypothetical protein [Cryomorphaceae bacterium]